MIGLEAAADRLLVSLPDIAALAQVKRPVVSMWRKRAATGPTPFPAPAAHVGDRELFALAETTQWLLATGRGNNPNVREEAALYATVEGTPTTQRQRAVDGLTALLALKVATGGTFAGMSRQAVLDLADDVDPQDSYLYREVDALGEDVSTWAAHTDAIATAAYTPGLAMAALLARRHRLGLAEHAATGFAPWALELAAALATEVSRHRDTRLSCIVDPFGSDDLVVAMRTDDRDDELLDVPVVTRSATQPSASGATTTRAARLGRRRLTARGWQVTHDVLEPGTHSYPADSLVLVQLPNAAQPHLGDRDVMAAVGDLAVGMRDDTLALVIAPASALVGPLREPDSRIRRADVLRTGRVRAVVHLPAGLWPARTRQRLALWVLGAAQPGVALGARLVAVADCADAAQDQMTIEALVTDVVAALGDPQSVRSHAFRYARPTPTSDLVAATGELAVASPSRLRPRGASPAELAVTVGALADRAGVRVVVMPRDAAPVARTTVASLVARRVAQLIPGNRLQRGDVMPIPGIAVIGVEEVLGTRRPGQRSIDRVQFGVGYPAGRYTEPGDVVFCTSPSMGAIVDTLGLSVVEYPARVLRLNRSVEPGLLPGVVAQALRSVSPQAWRRCPIPLVPQGQAVPLETALADIQRSRAELDLRRVALDELSVALADGVTAAMLELSAEPAIPVSVTEKG